MVVCSQLQALDNLPYSKNVSVLTEEEAFWAGQPVLNLWRECSLLLSRIDHKFPNYPAHRLVLLQTELLKCFVFYKTDHFIWVIHKARFIRDWPISNRISFMEV